MLGSFANPFPQVLPFLRSAKRRLEDVLLPPQCVMCRQRIMQAGSLCAACWSELDIIDAPRCERTGRPFSFAAEEGTLSPGAGSQTDHCDRIRASVRFDDHSRRLIHMLKYHDRHDAAGVMAHMMARTAAGLIGPDSLVVPVPLYRWRQWSRRYNQSALLAARIANTSGAVFRPEVLMRTRATRSQVGLNHSGRHKNVHGAFAVPQDRVADVSGSDIVIVDDVMTSGATVQACAAALKDAGARDVSVLAFALVVDG